MEKLNFGEIHTCVHDISLKTPRISSLAAKMYLEGDGQGWKAVEDRACMKFCTYGICGKEDYGSYSDLRVRG